MKKKRFWKNILLSEKKFPYVLNDAHIEEQLLKHVDNLSWNASNYFS